MRNKKGIRLFFFIALIIGIITLSFKERLRFLNPPEIGEPIDSLNGVYVFYNGLFDNVSGRNVSASGYNIGLKYQCVEFVKRYYLEFLKHEMPDSYGHAKDFFDQNLKDGAFNKQRGLYQFQNGGKTNPKVNDILVYEASMFNPYGHVAIISKVEPEQIEIIQQNSGVFGKTRETYSLNIAEGMTKVKNDRILGWLGKR